jgi:hypothetical protein
VLLGLADCLHNLTSLSPVFLLSRLHFHSPIGLHLFRLAVSFLFALAENASIFRAFLLPLNQEDREISFGSSFFTGHEFIVLPVAFLAEVVLKGIDDLLDFSQLLNEFLVVGPAL